MRGSVRRHVEVAVAADRAWAVVGAPEVLHHWFPGMASCAVDGDVRTVTTDAGLTLTEQILTNDPIQRRFQYRVTGGFFAEHLGTLDVIELGPSRCIVVYSSDADPSTMALVLGGATGAALEELRRQLESGEGPAIDAVADRLPADRSAVRTPHDTGGR